MNSSSEKEKCGRGQSIFFEPEEEEGPVYTLFNGGPRISLNLWGLDAFEIRHNRSVGL
jgi:hypothetical protein